MSRKRLPLILRRAIDDWCSGRVYWRSGKTTGNLRWHPNREDLPEGAVSGRVVSYNLEVKRLLKPILEESRSRYDSGKMSVPEWLHSHCEPKP